MHHAVRPRQAAGSRNRQGRLTRRRALFLAAGGAVGLALGTRAVRHTTTARAGGAGAAGLTVAEFDIPTPGSRPGGIVVGPDAALWFAESVGNNIGRITLDGTITEFPIPTPHASATNQAFTGIGPDGMVWFTESAANKLGRITPDGSITEFDIPSATRIEDPALGTLQTSFPIALAAGADGALWFNERETNQIGRMTLEGSVTEFPLPEGVRGLVGLTPGADGALWFTTNTSGHVGRIDMDGNITTYSVPTAMPGLIRLKAGPDGAIWWVAFTGNKIGRLTSDGQITEFDAPAGPGPDIAPGPDGAMWFTILNADALGRITLDGEVSTYAVLPPMSRPYWLVTGPDGALWFTEINGNRIGRAELTSA